MDNEVIDVLAPHDEQLMENALLEKITQDTCAVLSVSNGALQVIRHSLQQSDQAQHKTQQQWETQLAKVRADFSAFITQFNEQLEESQRITFEQKELSVQELSTLLSTTLTQSMENILFVSKRSIMMVYMLDEAMTSLASIEKFISDIKNVNRQANMLAVNASIEAIRAGQAGQNFAVVATEVKQIADYVKTLASNMHSTLRELSGNVSNGYAVLQEIATVDFTSAIESKEKMDIMLAQLAAQQTNTSQKLQLDAKQHQFLLQMLDNISASIKNVDATHHPLCGALEQIIKRQEEIKHTLGQQIAPDIPVQSDRAFADCIATEFALQHLNELLQDALDGKDVGLSMAMQNVCRIPHAIKE